jgi:hypothetical protein
MSNQHSASTQQALQDQHQLDIQRRVDAHDRDLAIVRGDIAGMNKSVEHLSSAVRAQDEKLDNIITEIRRHGTTTIKDVASVLQVMVLGGALISGIVTMVVYIASGANSAELAVMKHKVDRMYEQVTDTAIARYRVERLERAAVPTREADAPWSARVVQEPPAPPRSK